MPNPNSDPIDKQRAIVSGMTQGQVVWTAEHRQALQAAMDRDDSQYFSDQVWADVLKVIIVLMDRMSTERSKEVS